ncbi:Thaumatin family protein [Dioscorea alata]|uniref:Thaumatin family protein n=1 Tax=Dioscorea alata TaxID=55571 RepID=A0ACB7U0P7_DIOAL|nr:Thaumatin family protein [Dioscorea alata]
MAAVTSLIFFSSLLTMISGGMGAATFTFSNNCQYTVWPGTLSSAGRAALDTTGFVLQSGESRTLNAPTSWSGRFWGRTLCTTDSTGKFSCGTGDCGSGQIECLGGGAAPPATLAEFTLNGDQNMDFYDVSLVDGYNVPMLVVPQGGSGGNCSTTGCVADLNGVCPTDLRVTLAQSDGASENVACKSACEAFQTPQYCCSGAYGNPNTCHPSSYSEFFKNACPRAYSYAYDDATSTFTCVSANYVITFCPSTTSQKSGENSQTVPPLINDTMVFLGGEEVSQISLAAPPLATTVLSLVVPALFWLLLRLF